MRILNRAKNNQILNQKFRRSEVPETPPEPIGQAPENIPVPIEEEDDLVCDAYSMNEDQVWRFEVNIETRDIDMLRNDPDPTAFAFLVSAAKRQRSEVKLSTLTSAERQMFDAAKEKEIQSWLDTQTVCRILRHKIPMQNILKCRWILTWKDAENNTHLSVDSKQVGGRKAKARLVILGYQDPELSSLERDSPTLSKTLSQPSLAGMRVEPMGNWKLRHQNRIFAGPSRLSHARS